MDASDPDQGAPDGPVSLEGLFDDLADEDGDGEDVSVDDILDRLEHRSFGPVLLVPALIAVLPVIGALPGVSYAMAFLVFFVAIQFALSKPKLWLPGRLREMSFDRDKFKTGLNKAKPAFRWIDGFLSERFAAALSPPMPRIIAWVCVALGAMMVLYAAVPGGIVLPALAVVLLALGLTTHDGLVVALGFVFSAATLIGSVWVAMQLF